MNISLRKGTTYISVSFKDRGFSNNLYCSNTTLINGDDKIFEMDFHKIVKARIKTNSNDDLNDLIENLDNLKSISFSDKLITENLMRRIKQNEEIKVRFLAEQSFETKMKVVYKSKEEFELEK